MQREGNVRGEQILRVLRRRSPGRGFAEPRHLAPGRYIALLVCLTFVCAAEPAAATFPGTNGRIVFSASSAIHHYEIYSMAPNGSDLRVLASSNAADWFPSVSADGTKVAFNSDRGGNYDIWVMDHDGLNPVRLTSSPKVEWQPAWSPDGTKIAYVSNEDGGAAGIWVMDADGSDRHRISPDGQEPDWSPDGTRIAFTAVPPNHNRTDIWTMNPDGSDREQLTTSVERDWEPSWSPDSSMIVFTSLHDPGAGHFDCHPAANITNYVNVWVMDADGGNETRIGSNCIVHATFSPDGTKVLYHAPNGAVKTMDTAGQNSTQLLDRAAAHVLFSWSISELVPPAGLVVNTEDDLNDEVCSLAHCSLREAINTANAQAGTDTILFGIPGEGLHTIRPTSGLPFITQPVVIDGTSQPGFVGCVEGPVIELDGSLAGAGQDGIAITAGSSTVKGLTINRFGNAGIDLLSGDGNTVRCNRIGTDVTGTLDRGNTNVGIQLFGSSSNTIGGNSPTGRNLVSGNNGFGISLRVGVFEGQSQTNVIRGNYIGTDVTGTLSIANATGGVSIEGNANELGGTGDGEGNLISGNSGFLQSGVFISGSGNTLRGNMIGTTTSGMAALPNGIGVEVRGPNNAIGTPGAGNLVSGNTLDGIRILTTPAINNTVEGNLIGTLADGTGDLGNTMQGVAITTSASGNRVGGSAAGAGNVISGNNRAGVQVMDTAVNNDITHNSIHANSQLGIDLGGNGNTANDTDDPDNGPNLQQNHPLITSAIAVGGQTTISGSLNSAPSTGFRIEFFASPACHSFGRGEGQIYLGAVNVNTDSGGDVSFSPTLATAAPRGYVATATATSTSGNTSEFSACTTVTPSTRVRGTKFNDINSDGDKDVGEAGLVDWVIRAYSDDGDGVLESGETTFAETTTASDGTYQLDLDPGSYVICEVVRENWVQTEPTPADNECGDAESELADGGYALTLAAEQVVTGRDFGNRSIPPPRVTGVKYSDTSGDGDRDGGGESGIANWDIVAYVDEDPDGILQPGEETVAEIDSTDANGNYTLSLTPGSYVVCELERPFYQQTAPAPADNECGDDTAGAAPGGHAVTIAAGQLLSGRDFGNRALPPPRVTGAKYHDTNGDGDRDGGEPGVQNWTIRAYRDDGDGTLEPGETSLAAQILTDSSGNYSMTLPNGPGNYVICEVAQNNWEQKAPTPADNECGNSISGLADGGHAVTVDQEDVLSGRDFGNQQIVTRIRGHKFNDLNGDGAFDGGESGLINWTIRAYTDDGDGVLEPSETTHQQTTTLADGSYSFDVSPGSYVICEVGQATWTQTAPTPADNECGDTVVGLADGGYAVTISLGQQITNRDFGNRRDPTRVRGKKFNDGNGDGDQDGGEAGLINWVVRAYADDGDGTLEPSETTSVVTTTAADGSYVLNLSPGSYVICEETQATWTQTAPAPADNECGDTVTGLENGGHAITISEGQTLDNRDFGNRRDPTRVRGKKFNDLNGDGDLDGGEDGLGNWTIRIYADDGDGQLEPGETAHGETTTLADGSYTFDLAPGSYVICEVAQATWTQTAPTLADNECGDTVTGLGDGGHAITISEGQQINNRDFGNKRDPTRVRGKKFNDANGDGDQDGGELGLQDWVIRAYSDDGDGNLEPSETTSVQTTTAADGSYSLNLSPGSYVICEETQATWTQTAPTPADNECGDTVSGLGDGGHAVTITEGQTIDNRDFGNQRDPTRIRGKKFEDLNGDGDQDAGEDGLAGWKIRAYPDDGDGTLESGETTYTETTTAADGSYSFDPVAGSYVICEALEPTWDQIAPTPADNECGDTHTELADGGHALAISTGQQLNGRDFANRRTPTRIRGTKFNDLNGDGDQDAGEDGLSGWKIRAYPDDGDGVLESGETAYTETTTAADGSYSFAPTAGSYVICEVSQSTWGQVAPAPADNECGEMHTELADGGHALTISTSQQLNGRDFANRIPPPPPVTGSKFDDLNANGVRDPGEPGLANWTIQAYADDGDGVLEQGETALADEDVTDLNGDYSLTLPVGSYVVCEVAKPDWRQTAPVPSDNECGDQLSPLADGGHAITVSRDQALNGLDFGNFAIPPVPPGLIKTQRNLEDGGDFIHEPITAQLGDQIEYRLEITPGERFAGPVTVLDVMSSRLEVVKMDDTCEPEVGFIRCVIDPPAPGTPEFIHITVRLLDPDCDVVGTRYRDTKLGESKAGETICAAGGADVVDSLGGDDDIYGNQPLPIEDDPFRNFAWLELDGEPGPTGEDPRDFVTGTQVAADDRGDDIDGGTGDDDIRGQDGEDRLSGGTKGNDRIRGNHAGDTIGGGSEGDQLFGDDGADTIEGGSGPDKILGQDGSDDLAGDEGMDDMWGGPDNDVLVGGADSDLMYGEEGSDWLRGYAGNDWMFGGTGNPDQFQDALQGGLGDDGLASGDTTASSETGTGRDSLNGQEGDDILFGQDGSDCSRADAFRACPEGSSFVIRSQGFQAGLHGGGGRDHVNGGAGLDRLDGGDEEEPNQLIGGPATDYCSFGGPTERRDETCELPQRINKNVEFRSWCDWFSCSPARNDVTRPRPFALIR